MAQCKKPVGKGTVCYPCVVTAEHDGPCMSNENEPSKRARSAWLLAVEQEGEEAGDGVTVPHTLTEHVTRRQVPHPGAPSLSDFQGPSRTSATGLMEHVEEGIAGEPLSTIDTSQPGSSRTLRPNRPRTLWVGDPVEVNTPEPVGVCSICGELDHSELWKHGELPAAPTKTRPGDQPLPVVNDSPFIQDLVIEDFEARKQTGIDRYGTPLQAHNGRNVDLDLYEELLDATTYLRQKLVERQDLNDAVVGLTRLLEADYATEVPAQVWDYLNTLYAGTKVD